MERRRTNLVKARFSGKNASEKRTSSFPRLPSCFTSRAASVDSNDGAEEKYDWTRQNLAIALPALIGMLSDPLLSSMDTAYVGRLGMMELAALGSCTSIFHLAFNAFRATTAATTSLVAGSLHDDDKEGKSASLQPTREAQHVTSVSLALGVVMGLMVFAFLQFGATFCLACMGAPPNNAALHRPAKQYLRARAFAAPAVLWIGVSEGTFRGYGDTRTPLVAATAASIINLVLDPILMFPPIGWGVRGAAVATALSQLGSASVYTYFLRKRGMLQNSQASSLTVDEESDNLDSEVKTNSSSAPSSGYKTNNMRVIRTIVGANLAMMTKQGSLLLGWAYATARATRIGTAHVAAHQVALSCWLVMAMVLDSSAVSAQVLMSRPSGKRKTRSLILYYARLSILQGAAAGLLWFSVLGRHIVPRWFTTDPTVRSHLFSLVPHMALQQILVSATLVMESLAIGGKQFRTLAIGTSFSTLFAIFQIQRATSIAEIWSRGIAVLFAGRLLTALYGVTCIVRKP